MFALCLPQATVKSLESSLESGELKVPGRATLQKAEWKLDMCMSVWYRQELMEHGQYRYITVDASPKAGYQILGGTQQYITWPKGLSQAEQVRAELKVNRRYFPLATLPYGEFSVYEKACRVQQWFLMEGVDDQGFDQMRLEVRECGTDQGTEMGINNVANTDKPSVMDAVRRIREGETTAHIADTATAGFLFPNSLWIGDHLHMIYGALEQAVCSLGEWGEEFEAMLQDFSEFMNNKPLRTRFATCCLPKSHRPTFRKWAKRFVDWKWQYLELYLNALLPLLPLMILFFDATKILTAREHDGDKLAPLRTQVVLRIATHLQKQHLVGALMLLRACARSVGMFASWCDGVPVSRMVIKTAWEIRTQTFERVSEGFAGLHLEGLWWILACKRRNERPHR